MEHNQIEIKTSDHLHLNDDRIKLYWQIESKDLNLGSIKQLVLPSLQIELIFIMQGSLYVNGSRVDDPFVAPVLVNWKEVEFTPGTVIFGIRLNPVHFHLFSGLELNDLEQAPNFLKHVLCDRTYHHLTRIVFEVEDFENRVVKLNKFFFDSFRSQDEGDELILNCLNVIANQTVQEVNKLASSTVYSERWIQKLFKRKVGINPSKVIQISRFNRFLSLLADNSINKLSEACYEVGYSDQSHLIHDFNKFTDQTPKLYLREVPSFVKLMNCK